MREVGGGASSSVAAGGASSRRGVRHQWCRTTGCVPARPRRMERPGPRGLEELDRLVVAVARATRPVVAAEIAAIAVAIALVAADLVLVVFRRVLDLILGAVHEHRLGVQIDLVDHAGREHDLLAEDPWAGVDDDEARADVVRSLVDLPDRSVDSFDGKTGQVALGECGVAVRPDLIARHVRDLLPASHRATHVCSERAKNILGGPSPKPSDAAEGTRTDYRYRDSQTAVGTPFRSQLRPFRH